MNTASSSSSSSPYLQGHCKNQRKAQRQGDHRRGMQRSVRNTHASRRDRVERTRRNSENQKSQSSPRPLHATLKKWKTAEVVRAEENKCGERPSSGSRPSNCMGPRQEDSEFKALESDSTLGYPGEGPPKVPDLGSMERCNVCDLTPW